MFNKVEKAVLAFAVAYVLAVGWASKAYAASETIQVPLQCLMKDTVIKQYTDDGKHWQPLAVVSTQAGADVVLIIDTRDKETHVWLALGDLMCFIEGGMLSRFNVEALGLKSSKGAM